MDAGIYEFFEEGPLSIGVSNETGPETGTARLIYNVFFEGEYINIIWSENPADIVDDLVAQWNECKQLYAEEMQREESKA